MSPAASPQCEASQIHPIGGCCQQNSRLEPARTQGRSRMPHRFVAKSRCCKASSGNPGGRKLRARAALALALLGLSRPVHAEAPSELDPAPLARQHYQDAVRLAQAGELEKARAAFELAFRTSPHPTVLLSLAKVATQLQDNAGAAGYLHRYLQMRGDELPSSERERVQAQLALLEAAATRATARDGAASGGAAPTSPAPPLPEEATPTPPAMPEQPAVHKAAPGRVQRGLPPEAKSSLRSPGRTQSVAPDAGVSSQETLGLALAGSGLLVALGGGALWLWSFDAGRDANQRGDQLLANPPPERPANSDEVRAIRDYGVALGEAAADSSAARRMQVVGLSLAGVGVAALAAGIVTYVTSGAAPAVTGAKPALALTHERLAFTFNW